MLVMTAFIVLVGQGKVPAWIVAIIVCRELAVTGLRLLLVEHGEVMAAAWPGKVKTATQMVAIILLFINNIPFSALHLPLDQIMLYACLIFTIYSGVDYFAKNKDVFKGSIKRESKRLACAKRFLVFSLNQLMGCKIKQSGKIFI